MATGTTSSSSPLRTGYLVLYNSASAIAWAVVLARTVGLLATGGPQSVYSGVNEWLTWTQSMAAMEILHSLFGIVRAPIMTTIMQISSRLLLVWGIVYQFPHLALYPTYSSMLVAWSIAEIIRYSFFALSLSGKQPYVMTWLRYNAFYVLYPAGISSECSLVWLATGPAARRNEWEKYVLWAILGIYVPGTYVLFTHMMVQRKKVMRSLKTQDAKAQ